MKPIDANRIDQFNALTMEGTRSFHQVKSVSLDKTSLFVCTLSCFCKFCSNGGDVPCDNEAYIAPFNLVWLKPYNANDAHANLKFVPQLEIDQEVVAATIQVQDHFAIMIKEGNSEGSNFGFLFVRNHCMLSLLEILSFTTILVMFRTTNLVFYNFGPYGCVCN